MKNAQESTPPDWREVARQLGKPEGEAGLKTAQQMNSTNAGMTTRAIALLRLQDNEHVLEIGPGNGAHVPELLQQAHHLHYDGLDISDTMVVEAARLNAGQARVAFGLSDGLQVPFEVGTFDAIFTVNTVYFWQDPAAYAAEIHRVLRPGGRFVLAFAHADFMQKLPFTQHGFQLYTPVQAEVLLRHAAFAIDEIVEETETIRSNTGETLPRELVFVVARKEAKG
ncbi:hypothetical protein GCM10027275_08570 [Rhabdobacter roseus]|uniref:SAM-dependent methyltransferase n=1 Tax=Rhabdobacter roseus TaxID=1655419 RepID=A0A840TLV4_9BACT|nr:class I SAM-dependent methyltransferase [Rhabdobacter roseus]MBB5282757.1 SAM-dependent methyltransferase [Rhabdobacter roseus]